MITRNDAQSESVKERVALHLRAADILVKESRFEDAVTQIEVALDLDPKSFYARSFLERARAQMERARQKKELEQPDGKDAKATLEDQKIAQNSLLLRTADQLIAAKKMQAGPAAGRKSVCNQSAELLREGLRRVHHAVS